MAKFKVVMKSWGGTRRTLMTGLTEKEAFDFCEENHWEWDSPYDGDGGYIWDLEVIEE